MRLLNREWLIGIGPALAFALFFFLRGAGWDFAAATTAAITLLCALWWIFEPVPIPFTSLLPLALFPMLGVLTPAQVGQAYGSPLILLLLGGFLISEAMADSGAHRRLALYMVHLFGGASARSLAESTRSSKRFSSSVISPQTGKYARWEWPIMEGKWLRHSLSEAALE